MRYRKNYHTALKWSLVALLLIVALPFVLGTANYINEHYAAEKVTAYELKNDTNVGAIPYVGGAPIKFRLYEDSTQGKDLSPFWNANGSWDEVLIPTYTTNNSYNQLLIIGWNLTPETILKKNIDQIHIEMKGLYGNGTVWIKLTYIKDQNEYSLTTYHQEAKISNGTLSYQMDIDYAKISYVKSNIDEGVPLSIQIQAANSTYDPFIENTVIKFKIQAYKPHGGITVNGEDFVNFVAEIYGLIFIVAAVFATGAVNPTHKHMFGHLYYGIKRYLKLRRKRKYHHLRSKLNRYGHHRYNGRRWYR